MRRLLDDLLWLARFDATSGPPNVEPVDLGVLAAQAVDRFGVVAEARHLQLNVQVPNESLVINAPPEWLDRLLGVLLDNACKYSPEGAAVTVSVGRERGRVRLIVDDHGPGIPETERASASSTASTGLAISRAGRASGWPSPTRSCGQPTGAGGSRPARRGGARMAARYLATAPDRVRPDRPTRASAGRNRFERDPGPTSGHDSTSIAPADCPRCSPARPSASSQSAPPARAPTSSCTACSGRRPAGRGRQRHRPPRDRDRQHGRQSALHVRGARRGPAGP